MVNIKTRREPNVYVHILLPISFLLCFNFFPPMHFGNLSCKYPEVGLSNLRKTSNCDFNKKYLLCIKLELQQPPSGLCQTFDGSSF